MLIRDVEKFMREHDMPATKFGRLAAHDPRFVLDLRMGRIPRAKTEARTRAWMRAYGKAPEPCGQTIETKSARVGAILWREPSYAV